MRSTQSKFLDSLSDRKWAQSRYKRLEQAAFDAWAGSGRIYKKGVWYDREDLEAKLKGVECTVDDFTS